MVNVTYRTPSGQVITSDLNDAPPQVQTLYNQNYLQPQANLQQTQAAAGATSADIPGNIARSQTANIQAQQAGALQGLKKDLDNKMTLKTALGKYTALGMSPDDVFKQYLAESPWGLPHETPTELKNLGISDGALGKIGDVGSFNDRFNTRNAIMGLRDLQDKFHQTNAMSQIESNLGIPAGNSAAAYNSARNLFTEHLTSLIPGASGASGDIAKMSSSIPDIGGIIGDPRQYASGKASAQFNSVEDQLLKTKGYSYSDLGLTPPREQIKATTENGKDLLSTLLTNAGKDATGIIEGQAESMKKYGGGPGGAAISVLSGIPGLVKQYGDIVSDPIGEFQQHPLNTSLAVLGPLLGLKGGAPEASAGNELLDEGATTATTQAAKDVFSKAPGKLQQLLDPTKSKNVIGEIRDTLISNADKTGMQIPGENIAQGFRTWAEQAKLSNPADADAIEQAALNFEKQYAGKTFKPSQLKDVYDNIEKGYTAKGQPRTATSAYIDRGVQDVLQQQLEKAAPGFAKTTDLFHQTFNSEKSPVRGFAKGAAKSALGYGLGIAGFDAVRHILGL